MMRALRITMTLFYVLEIGGKALVNR